MSGGAVATADRAPLSFAVITPNSDALVREGLELDRHYVFMFCSPTRMSIMSGRLPCKCRRSPLRLLWDGSLSRSPLRCTDHVNQVNLATWARDWSMPGEMTALPAKLKQVGYKTSMVGKCKWPSVMASVNAASVRLTHSWRPQGTSARRTTRW